MAPEEEFFDCANGGFLKPDSPSQLMNRKVCRQSLKLRARLKVDAKLADGFSAGIGLATDTSRSPGSQVSTSTTLGDP
jgi:hypothetical protein